MDNRLEEFKDYLINKERSMNTIDSYIRSAQKFFANYEEVSKKNMMDFKRGMIENYKPKTAAIRCASMNVYCDFIEHPEYKVKWVKVHNHSTLENVISMEEYKYFLSCLKRDGVEKVFFMIKFLAATGCRASELVKLEKKCIETGYTACGLKERYEKSSFLKN